MRLFRILPVLLCLVQPAAARTAEPLLLVDNAGKEHKIKSWRFVVGVRHLGWLAEGEAPKPEPPAKPATPRTAPPKVVEKPKPVGPEAFELREDNSTTFKEGILTLVPLVSIRAIEFDNEKETITVRVAADKEDIVLTGSTAYKETNKLTIECDVDKGDLGVASVKFLGGMPKGIKSLKFPDPKKVPAATAGREVTITSTDKGKSTHKATDVQALYDHGGGVQKLGSSLMFKKTLKIDLAKIKKVEAKGTTTEGPEWEVTTQDGETSTLTLLRASPTEGKSVNLLGLLGRVPAGYKLFALPTVHDMQFSDAK